MWQRSEKQPLVPPAPSSSLGSIRLQAHLWHGGAHPTPTPGLPGDAAGDSIFPPSPSELNPNPKMRGTAPAPSSTTTDGGFGGVSGNSAIRKFRAVAALRKELLLLTTAVKNAAKCCCVLSCEGGDALRHGCTARPLQLCRRIWASIAGKGGGERAPSRPPAETKAASAHLIHCRRGDLARGASWWSTSTNPNQVTLESREKN